MAKDTGNLWPELRKQVLGIKRCLDQLEEGARAHGLTYAADLICEASEAIVEEALQQDPEPPSPATGSFH